MLLQLIIQKFSSKNTMFCKFLKFGWSLEISIGRLYYQSSQSTRMYIFFILQIDQHLSQSIRNFFFYTKSASILQCNKYFFGKYIKFFGCILFLKRKRIHPKKFIYFLKELGFGFQKCTSVGPISTVFSPKEI